MLINITTKADEIVQTYTQSVQPTTCLPALTMTRLNVIILSICLLKDIWFHCNNDLFFVWFVWKWFVLLTRYQSGWYCIKIIDS